MLTPSAWRIHEQPPSYLGECGPCVDLVDRKLGAACLDRVFIVKPSAASGAERVSVQVYFFASVVPRERYVTSGAPAVRPSPLTTGARSTPQVAATTWGPRRPRVHRVDDATAC